MTASQHSADSVATAKEYCQRKAIPEGANLYYACLFEEDQNKPRIVALHALLNELTEILIECSDPGVARLKYQWWQEELARLDNEQARHPVSIYIHQTIAPGTVHIQELIQAVAVFESMLLLEQPETMAASLNLFRNSAGVFWRQSANLADINDNKLLNSIETMAACYHLITALQYPRVFLSESCCVLPAETISVTELLSTDNSQSELKPIFEEVFNDFIKQLDNTYEETKRECAKQFRHGLILNRIARKTAIEIINNGSQLMTMRVGMTPIRKLLLAWWTNLGLR